MEPYLYFPYAFMGRKGTPSLGVDITWYADPGGRSLARLAGSNPVGRMDVHLVSPV